MTVAEIFNKAENINLKFQIIKNKLPLDEAAHVEKSIKAFGLLKQMIELLDFDANIEIPLNELPTDVKFMMEEMENQMNNLDKEAQMLVNEYFPPGS